MYFSFVENRDEIKGILRKLKEENVKIISLNNNDKFFKEIKDYFYSNDYEIGFEDGYVSFTFINNTYDYFTLNDGDFLYFEDGGKKYVMDCLGRKEECNNINHGFDIVKCFFEEIREDILRDSK